MPVQFEGVASSPAMSSGCHSSQQASSIPVARVHFAACATRWSQNCRCPALVAPQHKASWQTAVLPSQCQDKEYEAAQFQGKIGTGFSYLVCVTVKWLWNCICRTSALSTSLGPSRNLHPEEWAEGSEQAPRSLFSFVKSNTDPNLFECTSALPDGKDAMNYSNASRPEVARTWICKEQCLTYQPARAGKVPGTHQMYWNVPDTKIWR